MKSCLEKGFVYTRVQDQGHDYLREKFKQIREQQTQAKVESNVKPIIKGKSAHGR